MRRKRRKVDPKRSHPMGQLTWGHPQFLLTRCQCFTGWKKMIQLLLLIVLMNSKSISLIPENTSCWQAAIMALSGTTNRKWTASDSGTYVAVATYGDYYQTISTAEITIGKLSSADLLRNTCTYSLQNNLSISKKKISQDFPPWAVAIEIHNIVQNTTKSNFNNFNLKLCRVFKDRRDNLVD